MKGIPVADNIKNRLLIQEIDREAKLQEKIEKTHVVDKFFPYPPPVLGESHGQKRPPYSQDKTAHQKQHQAELHQVLLLHRNISFLLQSDLILHFLFRL